jgi:FkbM family methyltransferase
MAQVVARTRPHKPYPGWYFGIAEANPGPGEVLRGAIWRYCNARRLETPIRMSWGKALRVLVYLGNDVSRCLFVGGCLEPNEFAFLGECLEPGMVFIDGGANEGLYTLFAAERVGHTGTVLAAEASCREHARLLANIRLNGLENVRVRRIGLSDQSGQGVLTIAGYAHEGHNTLGAFHHQSVIPSHTEVVELQSLDELVRAESLGRVDVIKLDIEGAEFKALAGARQTLVRHRPLLLLEVADAALCNQGSSASELLSLLRELGYAVFTFEAASGRPTPRAEDRLLSENIVAAHPSRRWAGLSSAR